MEVAITKTNNLQIPQNYKNRLNVLDGFHVLYPSVIVTRVSCCVHCYGLASLLCETNHQSCNSQ